MILRNSLFAQNALHVTNLRTVYELCQMDERRVSNTKSVLKILTSLETFMMEESGRISRVQKESSSLMPQILQLNIEKV